MPESNNNRLTVVGARHHVGLFRKSNWARSLGARYCELLENSPGRSAWQFESAGFSLASLQRLSRHWPRLTFLLEFEVEAKRIKGLAKARGGELEHCEIKY